MVRWIHLLFLISIATAAPAAANVVCTFVVDAKDDRIVASQGDCDRRVSPASTFKLPLALMGFDAGVLANPTAPVLTIKAGDPDYGGEAWRRPVDPAAWMRHSVVWYSQRTTEALGTDRLNRYARTFRYGNADFSGDPGKANGLKRAWIGSSLQISAKEQALFVARFLRQDLGTSSKAYADTASILEQASAAGGWRVRGKTGLSFPRRTDGSFDRGRGVGWYIGYAELDGRRLAFARLVQDEGQQSSPASQRARSGLLAELPKLISEARSGAVLNQKRSWPDEKCRRYRVAWEELLQRQSTSGLSDGFVASHNAFIERNCRDPRDVCPRTAKEFDVANAMTIAAMNAGTASTFLPFACGKTNQ